MATLSLADILPLTADELMEFFRYVGPGPGACQVYSGPIHSEGYGYHALRGRSVMAHRLAWVLHSQSGIDREDHVLHSCDVRLCCNPDHLFVGSEADNQLDKARKGRGTTSALGMPYGVAKKKGARSRPFGARVNLGGIKHDLGHYETVQEAGRVAMNFKVSYLAKKGLTYQE